MMKKGFVKRFAVLTMAAVMMATAVIPCGKALNVFANDGTGIYAEENMTITPIKKEATVSASSANIREGAGTSYRILNTLERGAKIEIQGIACRNGIDTGWYYVNTVDKKYGGECGGYIHKSTLNVKDNSNDIEGQKMTVTGTKNYLGLRTEATSDDSKEIARLYNGYTVTVLRNEGKFAYVYSNNLGLEGYVKTAYLQ